MDLAEIRKLYEYNRWANLRFFDAIAALPEDRFSAAVASSFPSLQETLAHIVLVEWAWLHIWRGTPPTSLPPWATRPRLTDLRAELDFTDTAISEFLAAVSPADLGRLVTSHLRNRPVLTNSLGDLLIHLVNHCTYHRGQLATLMRQLAVVPPATDFLFFSATQPEAREVR